MITKQISGATPFQCLAHSFSVSPSAQGYTLQYSADGVSYTSYSEETPANEVLIVNGIAAGMWFRLLGNEDTLTLQY